MSKDLSANYETMRSSGASLQSAVTNLDDVPSTDVSGGGSSEVAAMVNEFRIFAQLTLSGILNEVNAVAGIAIDAANLLEQEDTNLAGGA